jgi:hypothetical protein
MDVRPKRRWYQFTVAGLLILTTLVSLPLGWFTYKRHKALQEQLAIDRFHKVIRDAEMGAQPQAIGKPWKEVNAQFVAAGYRPHSSSDLGGRQRYVIREDAWTASNGTRHNLIVDAFVCGRDVYTQLGQDDEVTIITAGLVGAPKISIRQAINERLYPPKSAVGLCLARVELDEDVKEYPILKKVEITYELIQNYSGYFVTAHVFGVKIDLGKSLADENAGMRLFYTVESNLDPSLDRNGMPLTQGFAPSFALGEVIYRRDRSGKWTTP